MGIIEKVLNFVRTVKAHRSTPLRLEFILTDHCNLNCKGCTHYSPLVDADSREPLERVIDSMEKLGRLNDGRVEECYLIGGETLLYPWLEESMEALRKNFPNATLKIFTNGLLIPRMTESFWKKARELDIVLAITRYPVKFDYDASEVICRKNRVRCEIFGDRSLADSFFKFGLDPEGKQNPRIAHFKCYNSTCTSVVGGRVYPCSISACVGHLNLRFGTQYKHLRGDYLEIDKIQNLSEIDRMRKKAVPFCRYCKAAEEVKYGPSHRELSEWS
ncbi:MAG: radical SAM protein [Clostridium sp.]|nr:radical SAM protein [Prevotella sp.]MCM1428904.1 radical SAM protein [Clostridium sp.]